MIAIKRCPKCETTKTADAFFKSARDGFSPYCKPCSAAYKRKGSLTRAEACALVYPEPGKKRCSKCSETKPLDEFNRRFRGEDVRSYCKACQYAGFKVWAGKRNGKPVLTKAERNAEITRAVFPTASTKVCPQCGLEKPRSDFSSGTRSRCYCKTCRAIKEKIAYDQQKDLRAKKRAAYREKNIERVREYARNGFKRRRAAKRGVETTLTTSQWLAILAKYRHRCLRCGSTGSLSMDHVVPISRGGAHSAENVQPLCAPCNSSKGTKTVDYRIGAEQ
jgi:5-methylcytosine-specific restriction endonuclease McrA